MALMCSAYTHGSHVLSLHASAHHATTFFYYLSVAGYENHPESSQREPAALDDAAAQDCLIDMGLDADLLEAPVGSD